MPRKVTFIALLLTLMAFSACRVHSISKANSVKNASDRSYTHYFSENPNRLVFKSWLQISKQTFSGLLIIKEFQPAEYRSIFTTETGFKVFDFTIKNDSYNINYAVGALNKKFIAGRLAYTIQAMLLRDISAENVFVSNIKEHILQSYPVGKYVYELKSDTGSIKKVESQAVYIKSKKKAEATFYGLNSSLAPDSSFVKHIGFPLQATFRWIKD